MRKTKCFIGLILLAVCLITATAALAADTFAFTERNVTLFEDETWTPELIRDGRPAEDGELTFKAGNAKVVSVAADGTVTGLQKGQTQMTATLKVGRNTWKASVNITVARRVTNVTLSTKGLTVYEPEDPAIVDLLKDDPAWPVIVLSAGKSVNLSATCTPDTASDRKVIFESTDEGIMKATERTMQGVQAGECDLIISSRQNPEVTEIYHVLVTQPVTKMEITAAGKSIPVGGTLELGVRYTPVNATIKGAEWKSRNAKVATVDEDGVVTGVSKGTVTIEAKAIDGSGKSASFNVTVTQPAQTLTLKNTSVQVVTGRKVTLNATVGPNNTDDKTLSWSSSDGRIATVSKGIVTGVKAGECDIYCVSNSNPDLVAIAHVQVIQQVTSIEFSSSSSGISLPVGSTEGLSWTVYPADASIQDVTFSSNNPRVATVDANGIVKGLSKGNVNITASATDGSGKKGSIRVTVTQPVEGMTIQYDVYHVQLERVLGVKGVIEPSNANNYEMEWYLEDESIASVRPSKNFGNVRGLREGVTTITGVTVDGGFSDTAEIRVADFNGAVQWEQVWVKNNMIRLAMRNMSNFVIEKVYFRVECYDQSGNLMVSNLDGQGTSFDGNYPLVLYPGEGTDPDEFDLSQMGYEQPLGKVIVRITGWLDSEGYRRNINEVDDQPMMYWSGRY